MLQRVADAGQQARTCVRRQAAGCAQRVEPGADRRLVNVDVAEFGDDGLVEQDRLQAGVRTRPQASSQRRRGQRRVERVGPVVLRRQQRRHAAAPTSGTPEWRMSGGGMPPSSKVTIRWVLCAGIGATKAARGWPLEWRRRSRSGGRSGRTAPGARPASRAAEGEQQQPRPLPDAQHRRPIKSASDRPAWPAATSAGATRRWSPYNRQNFGQTVLDRLDSRQFGHHGLSATSNEWGRVEGRCIATRPK